MSAESEIEVLLVEDNSRDAEMTFRTFRRHGLANHFVHVKDGEEAIDWLFRIGRHAGRHPPDRPQVVLLDLKLPKVDGLEVLRAIRANERTRNLVVVVLTSSREPRDLRECYALGVNSYVVKPLDADVFSAILADVGRYWLLINQPPPFSGAGL